MKFCRICLLPPTFLLLASLGFNACDSGSGDKPIDLRDSAGTMAPQEPEFSVPQELQQSRYKVVRHDFTGDGFSDAILSIASDDSLHAPGTFERLAAFEYSPGLGTFVPIFEQDYVYGETLELVDLTNDGNAEVVVHINSGGNSSIVSEGIHVLRYHANAFETLYYSESGAPELVPLAGSDVTGIFLFDEYWPYELSHAEAVWFLDSIVVAAPLKTERRDTLIALAFDNELLNAQQDYQNSKDAHTRHATFESAFAIYSHAVKCIHYLHTLDQNEELQAFIRVEKAYWRKTLSEEYVQALADVMASIAQAKEGA